MLLSVRIPNTITQRHSSASQQPLWCDNVENINSSANDLPKNKDTPTNTMTSWTPLATTKNRENPVSGKWPVRNVRAEVPRLPLSSSSTNCSPLDPRPRLRHPSTSSRAPKLTRTKPKVRLQEPEPQRECVLCAFLQQPAQGHHPSCARSLTVTRFRPLSEAKEKGERESRNSKNMHSHPGDDQFRNRKVQPCWSKGISTKNSFDERRGVGARY